MYVTVALQITEYSLISNSCMSVQRKTQLRLKEGTMYYQLEEFSYIGNSSMPKELSPSGLCSYFKGQSSVQGIITHRWQLEDPGETTQGDRRFGG